MASLDPGESARLIGKEDVFVSTGPRLVVPPPPPVLSVSTTWYLLRCVGIACMSSLLLGYDIGILAGAIVQIERQLHLSTTQCALVASAVNAVAVVGALVGGSLADAHGRRRAMLAAGLLFALGGVFMASAHGFGVLLFGRAVAGAGVGVGLVVAPAYIAELSPPTLRGQLVSLNEVVINVGIPIAYLVALLLSDVHGGWRWMLGLSALPALALLLGVAYLPESPRWLVLRGRMTEARLVLARVYGAPLSSTSDDGAQAVQAEPQFTGDGALGEWEAAALKAAVEEELERIYDSASDPQPPFSALLTDPALRRAMWVAGGLAFFQQASGIEAVVLFSNTLFSHAGALSDDSAMVGTLFMGSIKVVFTLGAAVALDRLGRRPMLLAGQAGVLVCLAALAALFCARPDLRHESALLQACAITVIMLFVASFALGPGPCAWLLPAELLPSASRARGAAAAAVVNRATAFLVALTFLWLARGPGVGVAFAVYACLSALGLLFAATQVPETAGLALEDTQVRATRRRRKRI